MVISLFRLEAKLSHFAPHVEAPTPAHNHEALDLGKDLDLGMGIRGRELDVRWKPVDTLHIVT